MIYVSYAAYLPACCASAAASVEKSRTATKLVIRGRTRKSQGRRRCSFMEIRSGPLVVSLSWHPGLPNVAAGRRGPVRSTMLLDGGATRYSTHMKVTIDLSPAQGERLRQAAERLGLTPEDLARAAVADLLATRDDDFEAAAKRVLQKNQELYRRLA